MHMAQFVKIITYLRQNFYPKNRGAEAFILASTPRFFAFIFYAFRTPFQKVFDKSFSYPADRPSEALKTAGFYPSKCVGRWYLFLCRSASLRRRIFLAQAGQYFARLDFGVKLAPHSQQRFTVSCSFRISAHRTVSSGRTAARNQRHSREYEML